MLPSGSIMSGWQAKKITTQDLIVFVLNKSEHKSVHNVASSLIMSIILSHDYLTSESKASFNQHCGFSINETSDFSKDTSITFKQQYGCFLKMLPNQVI